MYDEWTSVSECDLRLCVCVAPLQKLGLLALMNEESHFPKATDATLLEKLHSQHSVSLLMHAHTTFF